MMTPYADLNVTREDVEKYLRTDDPNHYDCSDYEYCLIQEIVEEWYWKNLD